MRRVEFISFHAQMCHEGDEWRINNPRYKSNLIDFQERFKFYIISINMEHLALFALR